MPEKSSPRLLFLDIEWRPALVYSWNPYNDITTPEKMVKDAGLLCVGLKFLGDKKTTVFTEWTDGHEAMLQKTHAMMSEADAVVTFNGNRYDLPKLNGEFVLYDMPPPPPVPSIDLYQTTKKFGYFIGKLGFVTKKFGIGSKTEHEGMALWTKVIDGDPDAQKRMEKYCAQDVDLLIPLYHKIRAYIKNHPYLGDNECPDACPTCREDALQKRGWRTTKFFKIRRLACSNCGAWHDGERTKICPTSSKNSEN